MPKIRHKQLKRVQHDTKDVPELFDQVCDQFADGVARNSQCLWLGCCLKIDGPQISSDPRLGSHKQPQSAEK